MATKRWNADRSSALALKNGEVNLAGGHDDHFLTGYNIFNGDSYRNRGAVRFALSWSGVGKIVSAVLSVKTTGYVHLTGPGSDPDIYVQRITQAWTTNARRSEFDSPAGSGWNSDPDDWGDIHSTETDRATLDVTTSQNTWDSVDITDIAERWAPSSVQKRSGAPGDALPNYGLLIRAIVEDSTGEDVEFFGVGQNAASLRPTILLTYTDTGSAPTVTVTAPTGTIATSTPDIAGTYADADGDAMGKLDIQVSTVSTFASTTWNVAQTTVFSAPTTATWSKAYGGSALAPGSTYFIRARVYDSHGSASAWATTVSFTVQALGGTGSGGSITPKPPAFRTRPARIELYDIGANRGIGALKAIIDDAKYIGGSDYWNEVGEAYWTLPYNHPAIAEIVPLQRHYRISRYDAVSGTYKTLFRGIIDDYDADEDEVIIYGADYKSTLETSITAASTTYAAQFLGLIVQAELSAARTETASRLAFTASSSGSGNIENTSTTAIMTTAYQQRLQFIQQIAQVSMASSSVRTVFSIDRDSPFTWRFIENKGSEEVAGLRWEYGGVINGFRYVPGFASYANRVQALGIRREGASILYSTQSADGTSLYGRMTRAQLFQDVTDQTTLDKMTQRSARLAATAEKHVSMALRVSQVIPWDGWDIGDNARIQIHRGSLVNLNALYTLAGVEWVLSPEGGEQLYVAITTKQV